MILAKLNLVEFELARAGKLIQLDAMMSSGFFQPNSRFDMYHMIIFPDKMNRLNIKTRKEVSNNKYMSEFFCYFEDCSWPS